MQASLTDRVRWPWWLVAALVATLMAMWLQPWRDEAVVAAPAPAPTLAERVAAPPASRPAPAPIEAATPTPALKLVGTVTTGAGSFATVLHTSNSQLLQLRVGDRVDGLAVTAIKPDRVVLAGAAQPIVIEADRTVAVSAPSALSGAVGPAPPSQVDPPTWTEGEAPWDLAPPFRH